MAYKEPDWKTWERYQRIIASLPWEWKANDGQDEIPPQNRAGILTAKFTELPEGSEVKTLKSILSGLLDHEPQELHIDGKTVINARCNQLHDFSDNFGIHFDKKEPKKKKQASEKIAVPDRAPSHTQRARPAPEPTTLADAVFYRSHPPGTKVYVFVPQPKDAGFVNDCLSQKSIKLYRIDPHATKSGQKGTRMEVAPESIESLQKLLQSMEIPLHPNPHISLSGTSPASGIGA